MKLFASLLLAVSFAVPLAFAQEETSPQDQPRARKGASNASRQLARNAEVARRGVSQPNFQRRVQTAPQANFRPQQTRINPGVNPNINRQLNVDRPPRVSARVYTPGNGANNLANADLGARSGRNWRGDGNASNNWNRGDGVRNWRGNGRFNNGDGNANRNWDGGDGNRNWKNRRGDRARWANYRNWERSRHDRGWWRNRYTRFALFGGGYYYYNSGFWYPAYGYDPYFSTYSYDAPIYAYNDQDPGRVIGNVQTELSRRGYDAGPIDGTYGPATRNALLNFQADNGLEESGEIDEATLDALGLQ